MKQKLKHKFDEIPFLIDGNSPNMLEIVIGLLSEFLKNGLAHMNIVINFLLLVLK